MTSSGNLNPTADKSAWRADGVVVAGSTAAGAAPFREGPGTRIGLYKIVRLIGEGGFGSVFLAEQEKPVQRSVALKIIKLGMDTRQVVARFEQEQQVLAMMDHPNIARVLEAGATDTGRPYFVMELVKGDPIVEYCDTHSLSIPERLELFAQVCTAVQHAHTKGIIHRDIKPSNILVSMQDGRPNPKVIDFGIAKATGARLTDKTLFTENRQLIGTPEYMSPEQAEGSMDIDILTDVYSLGAVLYELLAGSTPFDSKELRSGAFAEIQRIIREVEPPRPSTRIGQSGDSLAGIAAHRHIEPRRLGTIIRGELDWIAMKAMEKDRQRRYETAYALAMDIGRYLAGEAVLAAPPSTTYRVRKFIKRNRGVVLAGASVAAALLIGVVAFAWQAKVSRDQRDRAVSAEVEAKKRAEELKQVSEFQVKMLNRIDPHDAGVKLLKDLRERVDAALAVANPPVPEDERIRRMAALDNELRPVNATDAAREMIDRTIFRPAIAAIKSEFKDQPVVEAQMSQTLATLYQGLGLYDAAFPLQEYALATRRRELGEEHPDTLTSMSALGNLLRVQGKPAEAEPYLWDSLAKRRRVLGEEHPDTLTSIALMGNLRRNQGKLAEAERYWRESLEKSRRVLGEEHRDTLNAIGNMGLLLLCEGRLAEAELCFREEVEKSGRVRGEEDLDTLTANENLGFLLLESGKLAEAEPYCRTALETKRRVMGDEHPTTLTAIRTMGTLYVAQGKYTEALTLLAPIEGKCRTAFTDAFSYRFAAVLTSLGSARSGLAKAPPEFAAAEANLLDAHAIYERTPGPYPKWARDCTRAIADLYAAWDNAEPGKGYDVKAAEWKAKLEAVPSSAAAPAIPVSSR